MSGIDQEELDSSPSSTPATPDNREEARLEGLRASLRPEVLDRLRRETLEALAPDWEDLHFPTD